MDGNLYEIALMLDPVGAEMVRIALEDGEIEATAAALAWSMIASCGLC
jgi:hypothetical protein